MKALITGASSGIGEEFAYIFAQNRYDLILVARSKKELNRVACECRKYDVNVHIIACDLTLPECVKKVIDSAGEVDVLINNAGFGVYGSFTDTSWDEESSMINLNIKTLTQLSKHYVSVMKKGSRILHVASTAAFIPGPRMAVYYATKAYVLSFSLALSQEANGVSVTCLCPGPTKTGFASRAGAEKLSFFKQTTTTAQGVARSGFSALMRRRRLVVSGVKNKVMVFLTRFLSKSFQARLVDRLSRE